MGFKATITEVVNQGFYVATRTSQQYRRVWLVEGLPPNWGYISLQGATDPASGITIPTIGDLLTGVPNTNLIFPITCSNVRGEPFPRDSKTSAHAIVDFTTPDGGGDPNITVIEIGDSNGNTTMQYNAQTGQVLSVSYQADAGASGILPPLQNDVVAIPVLSPNTILRFTKTFTSCPLALSIQYRRKLNATTWQGCPPSTVLCRGFSAISTLGGAAFRGTLAFEIAPPVPTGSPAAKYGFGPWTRVEFFRDHISGQIPPDILAKYVAGTFPGPFDGSTGILVANPYATAEFNALGLPTVAS
jgi:hypothetical protein